MNKKILWSYGAQCVNLLARMFRNTFYLFPAWESFEIMYWYFLIRIPGFGGDCRKYLDQEIRLSDQKIFFSLFWNSCNNTIPRSLKKGLYCLFFSDIISATKSRGAQKEFFVTCFTKKRNPAPGKFLKDIFSKFRQDETDCPRVAMGWGGVV